MAVSEAFRVSPAAMTMVASGPAVQAPATPVTVTVTAAADGPLNVAVSVATPPFSEIDAGDAAKVTVGAASSSAIVSTAPLTPAAPCALAIVPITVTCRSGSSMPSSTAVTAAAAFSDPSAGSVRPAGMTMRAAPASTV